MSPSRDEHPGPPYSGYDSSRRRRGSVAQTHVEPKHQSLFISCPPRLDHHEKQVGKYVEFTRGRRIRVGEDVASIYVQRVGRVLV